VEECVASEQTLEKKCERYEDRFEYDFSNVETEYEDERSSETSIAAVLGMEEDEDEE